LVVKAKSISLLFALFISIAPWSMLDLCPNHPEGHEEQGHHGNCKDGMMGDHQSEEEKKGPSFNKLPCTTLAPATDDFQASFQLKLPTVDQFILVAVLLELIKWEFPEQEFYPLPDPHSNSDPPLGINALRGPPFV